MSRAWRRIAGGWYALVDDPGVRRQEPIKPPPPPDWSECDPDEDEPDPPAGIDEPELRDMQNAKHD